MKYIKLSGKNSHLSAIVDDEDYEKVSNMSWYLNHKGYPQRNRRQFKYVVDCLPTMMHGFILGSRDGLTIDHINNNKLDNRKPNLRFISNTENIRRRGREKTSTTGYKGVYICKSKDLKPSTVRYYSYIRVNKKLLFVGYFKSKEEAALAYNEASRKYHGEFGYQNII